MIYKWLGEEQFPAYFGLLGFKCLCIMLKEEVNKIRANAGLPEYTWSQILTRMDTLMEENKADETHLKE